MSVNPLSCPKGVRYNCELCGKTATIQCTACRVTYYCTKEHQRVDAHGIHDKICSLLAPLRIPPPVIGSEEERAKRQVQLEMSQRALIELTKNEASKFLVRGEYEYAIPGALQALRFSIAVFGQGEIELVPPYLLLAEANLGLGRFKQAEEFLSLANWSVLKHPECSSLVRSQLHRNFGKLYAAQGRYEEALAQLAKDVYYCSLEIGPEHVDTSGGFYQMADVFYAQTLFESALAFYDKVVDIWYKFLANVRNEVEDMDALGEAQIAEAMAMLDKILGIREKVLGNTHIATGEARYTLGLLHLLVGSNDDAHRHVSEAASIYRMHLGDEHPSTIDVQDVLNQLNEARLFGDDAGSGGKIAVEAEETDDGALFDAAAAGEAELTLRTDAKAELEAMPGVGGEVSGGGDAMGDAAVAAAPE